MKSTIDTYSKKRFPYNGIVVLETTCAHGRGRWFVPGRVTACKATHLHPDRVPLALLMRLNPDKSCGHAYTVPYDPIFPCWCDDCCHYLRQDDLGLADGA